MSDLGYFSARQIAPSQSLKQILTKGTWSFCQLEDFVIASVKIPWTLPLDPFGLLNFSRPCWKFFWQSRASQNRYVALGALLKASSQDAELLEKLASKRLFGGLCFPGLDESDGLWEGFNRDFFVLPEVEWSIEDGKIELCLRVKTENVDSKDHLLELAAKTYRNYAPSTLGESSQSLPPILSMTNLPQRSQWNKMIESATSDISLGKYRKVVLSRCKELLLSQDLDLGSLLRQLSDIKETSYLFALVEPDGKAFVGRSPERLLAWDDRTVSVDAIAGTRKRVGSLTADLENGQDLQGSDKDIEEHRFVADFVRSTLEHYCDDVVQDEKEQLLRLRHVQHMRSKFTAKRRQSTKPTDLLKSLHPTPAVGGVPTREATASISEFEPFNRGLFAGAVGMIDKSGGDFAIGIRTAIVKANSLILFAGAGIVEASQPDAEWQETEIKMNNFLELFGTVAGRDESSQTH